MFEAGDYIYYKHNNDLDYEIGIIEDIDYRYERKVRMVFPEELPPTTDPDAPYHHKLSKEVLLKIIGEFTDEVIKKKREMNVMKVGDLSVKTTGGVSAFMMNLDKLWIELKDLSNKLEFLKGLCEGIFYEHYEVIIEEIIISRYNIKASDELEAKRLAMDSSDKGHFMKSTRKVLELNPKGKS